MNLKVFVYLKYIMTIFVFDFDMTLTTVHSGGEPEPSLEYFGNKHRELLKMLHKLKEQGHKVYVNTRGNCILVKECLNTLQDISVIGHLISSVKGANDSNEISDPYESDKFDKIVNKMHSLGFYADDSSLAWAYRKKEILDEISKENNSTDIRFFDDTAVNIMYAKKFYPQSYLVNSLEDTISKVNMIIQ